ncbi:DUF2922 domain-containing protein [Apilactobacillus bombintestini]|uniref:DUF2922 domain-containing protein n=1 Tax=Apilactobacillus bombintestini TaxID=2419772 RepID=A0A387AY53_9LACO|nr:DUF2922 domain-containing protein [Apilactobacillus bombintestini]AYF91990.1 DUF2922 domain-containing protein [Apilactobacillus bombintestini]
MKKLVLTFKSDDGKNKKLNLNYVEGSVDREQVMGYMNRLASLNIFQNENGSLYRVPVAAKVVDTNTNSLFDTRKEDIQK